MNHPKLRRWTLGARYIIFPLSSFCECVCVCFCVRFCLHSFAFTICSTVLSLHFCFCFCFFYLKKFFLLIIFYFNNFILFYLTLFYFILSSFFLFFLPFILSREDEDSWCSRQASGLCLWGGRANFKTLGHKRPPSSMWNQMAKISHRSPSQHQDPASLNDQQATVLDTLCRTTKKTGTQPQPLAERLPKVIILPQTHPKNTTRRGHAQQKDKIQPHPWEHRQ